MTSAQNTTTTEMVWKVCQRITVSTVASVGTVIAGLVTVGFGVQQMVAAQDEQDTINGMGQITNGIGTSLLGLVALGEVTRSVRQRVREIEDDDEEAMAGTATNTAITAMNNRLVAAEQSITTLTTQLQTANTLINNLQQQAAQAQNAPAQTGVGSSSGGTGI